MRFSCTAALLALGMLTAAPVMAADRPDGEVIMHAHAAAVGVGYTWGDGVLIYHGVEHHFSVRGLTVADLGFSDIRAHGRVFNLHHLHDFDGTYAALTGEATVGRGLGGQVLRNGNGVEINIDEVTKGARLSASADGIELRLRD